MDAASEDSSTLISSDTSSGNTHCNSVKVPDCATPAQETLTRINKSFEEAKANQILRLLKDQETLNKFFIAKAEQNLADSEQHRPKIPNNSKRIPSDAMKNTLSRKMTYDRPQASRAKTAMGFNKEYDSIDSSEDENMSQEEPIVNTRVNRPKSSYVRRTSAVAGSRTPHYQPATSDVENPRRGSARPKSRLGRRPSDAGRYNRQVLKEKTNTTISVDEDDGAQCVDDLIDVKDYDNCTNTTYEPLTLKRQRSNIKLRQKEDGCSEMSVSGEYSSTPERLTGSHQEQENVLESNESPILRHRRQQLRSARSSREYSENLYISRQNTESSGLERSPSNLSLRPKSERILTGARVATRSYLSIDTNPVQGSQLNSAYFDHKPGAGHPPERLNYGAAMAQQRPVSRRGALRNDVQATLRPQNKNISLYGSRTQPLGLMKLPPLDASIPARTERSLVIAARETCA